MPALVERVLRTVIQAGYWRGEIQEAQCGFEFPHGVAHILPTDLQRDAVQVVVVNERHQTVRAFTVHILVVKLVAQLIAILPITEHALDVLAQREEERRVERIIQVLAERRQRVVVIGKQLAKKDEIVFAASRRVLADVISPLLDPVVFHVLDGIHTEAVAVRRVNQVLERLGKYALHRRVFGLQVVRALELAQQVFRAAVPAVDGAVVVEVVEVVEGRRMLVVLVPPAECIIAAAPVLLVILLVVAPEAVFVAHVVGRDIQNHIDACGMQRVNQFLQFSKCAHGWVALEKVFGVVLVIRRIVGIAPLVIHLHTGHPDCLNAHACQITDIVFQALPIATMVIVAIVGEILAFRFPAGLVARQLVHAGIREAVGKQLIDIDVAPIGWAGSVCKSRLKLPRLESIGGIVHAPTANAFLFCGP
ncbi:MAG: hypothetical protein BWX54_01583 [Verrucomicrobia bacterium ADurb.Bin018]|nr:MAG: hypothetical protein BWX54_01583 [Verrucomicrobia bacterium ADurb.Bin018]